MLCGVARNHPTMPTATPMSAIAIAMNVGQRDGRPNAVGGGGPQCGPGSEGGRSDMRRMVSPIENLGIHRRGAPRLMPKRLLKPVGPQLLSCVPATAA